MTSRDIAHRVKLVPSISPIAKIASMNGSTVDTAASDEYEAAAFYVDFGAYTDGNHQFTFQDSADGTNWNNLSAGTYNGSPVDGILDSIGAPNETSNSLQNSVWICGYHGSNRYLRVITTVSGATTGAIYGAGVLLGYPHHLSAF